MLKKSLILCLFIFLFTACEKNAKQTQNQAEKTQNKVEKTVDVSSNKALVTFIELGSVNCVPCKMMQPVMKSLEKKYQDQLKIVFYDVWQQDQQIYAQKYGIQAIPTQVFLNKDGKEIHRHEGFYDEKEIDGFLKQQGLTIKQ